MKGKTSGNIHGEIISHPLGHTNYQLVIHSIIHPFNGSGNASATQNKGCFLWLLLKDRLSTRNIMRRKNTFLPSYSCVLCALDTEETVQHLFLQCEFARHCWQIIGVDIPSDADFPNAMTFLKDFLHSQFYMEAIILLCCLCSRTHLFCFFLCFLSCL